MKFRSWMLGAIALVMLVGSVVPAQAQHHYRRRHHRHHPVHHRR